MTGFEKQATHYFLQHSFLVHSSMYRGGGIPIIRTEPYFGVRVPRLSTHLVD